MNVQNQVKGELTGLKLRKFNGEKREGDGRDDPCEVYEWEKGSPATVSRFDDKGNLLSKVEIPVEELPDEMQSAIGRVRRQ